MRNPWQPSPTYTPGEIVLSTETGTPIKVVLTDINGIPLPPTFFGGGGGGGGGCTISGFGVGGYGQVPYDTMGLTHGFTTTPHMALRKQPYGTIGWGANLNDMFDKADALAARITALGG